jgi:hypothetical protein
VSVDATVFPEKVSKSGEKMMEETTRKALERNSADELNTLIPPPISSLL